MLLILSLFFSFTLQAATVQTLQLDDSPYSVDIHHPDGQSGLCEGSFPGKVVVFKKSRVYFRLPVQITCDPMSDYTIYGENFQLEISMVQMQLASRFDGYLWWYQKGKELEFNRFTLE